MAATPQRALIVIDLQNDYFPDGKFPLWNTEAVLAQVESAIARARGQGVPVILVQHIADAPNGAAPFFNAGTSGVELHPRILAAAPDAVVVTKAQADGFLNTTLEEKLAELGVDIAVAEEAAQTAEYFGGNVDRIYDVGVSGLHRLLSRLDQRTSRRPR